MPDDPIVHVALYQPLIPQNTGNIGRLVTAMRGRLHLVEPLGFSTDERACRRAGLDYWAHLDWRRHPDYAALLTDLGAERRIFAFSTRATYAYTEVKYRWGDCVLMGSETEGLPQEVLDDPRVESVRIPLRAPEVRSLNLANATAIAVSEIVRQLGHPDPSAPRPRRPRGETCERS